jgi:GNAT superfamily N-acetyltransferase
MFDSTKIKITKAKQSDHQILTNISFSAKMHWDYPDHYFDLWKNELTITEEYIEQNIVYKANYNEIVIGFYSIIENKSDFYTNGIFIQKGFWLEHIFIVPEYHGNGVGRLLINHARYISNEKGISNLMIFVDPYARGFYEKIGAQYLFDSKSSVPGRLIPVYNLNFFE